MNTRDRLKIMEQVNAANEQHIKDWKQRLVCDRCTDKGHCPEYQPGAVCVNDRNMKEAFQMSKMTMSDMSVELAELHAICDVTVSYAVGDANNDPNPLDKLGVMLQLIQSRVAALDRAASGDE